MHKRKMLVLAEGLFTNPHGKTAHGVVRYIPEQVCAVIDSTNAGKTSEEVIGYGGGIPIISSIEEGLKFKPDTLIIGIALVGGVLPIKWKKFIIKAIKYKLNVINGLHTFLTDDRDIMKYAKRYDVEIIDLRKPSVTYHVASGKWKEIKSKVILSVGTDCAIGKKTAIFDIYNVFKKMGKRADFIPTGQTGMLIAGKGIAIDAVKSDFVAGVMELEVVKSAKKYDFIFIEGQGALTNQGYSGVTMGLIHGVMPDAMILCHELGRKYDHFGDPIRDLKSIIKLHEMVVGFYKKSIVIAMNLITNKVSEEEALKEIKKIEKKLKMPVDDTVRFGAEKLANAVLKYFEKNE
jgi:uncharacterized NAD-dependent epimerase/dehydratase family protein